MILARKLRRSQVGPRVAYCEGNVTGAGSERLDGVRLSRGLFAAADVTIDRGVKREAKREASFGAKRDLRERVHNTV